MTSNSADAALFARLRDIWQRVDPVPAELIDRMVAAVAIEDLSREYALLTLVEGVSLAAVRGEADALTLQFSDGTTSVLVHVAATEGNRRRVDGWVDGVALSVRLAQGNREWAAAADSAADGGRFAFDDVPPGLSHLRLIVKHGDGVRDFRTPQFDV